MFKTTLSTEKVQPEHRTRPKALRGLNGKPSGRDVPWFQVQQRTPRVTVCGRHEALAEDVGSAHSVPEGIVHAAPRIVSMVILVVTELHVHDP